MLAAWHATLEVGTPVASAEFLVGVFEGLGEHKREVLKLAARFRGRRGLPRRRRRGGGARHRAALAVGRAARARSAAGRSQIYVDDRIGGDN